MEQRRTRVLLVDDHAMFREGLRELLEQRPDIEVVAEAATGQQALECLSAHPDVIVLDIKLPDIDGIAVCRRIREADGDARIVMLTMYGEDEYLFQALQCGASGYVMKHASSEEVVAAIRAAAKGQTNLDPATTTRLLEEYRRLAHERGSTRRRPLSERDLIMLRMIADGATNREIAEYLTMSEQTVKNSLSVLYQRLDVRNRAEAIWMAVQEGIYVPSAKKTEDEQAQS